MSEETNDVMAKIKTWQEEALDGAEAEMKKMLCPMNNFKPCIGRDCAWLDYTLTPKESYNSSAQYIETIGYTAAFFCGILKVGGGY